MTADAAIVTEPTGLDVAVAHRGFVWLDLETRGRAAHGSRYDLGIDAIARMGAPLVAIDELDKRLRDEGEVHPLLGGASLHASLIEGGTELSTYPDRCVVKVERRTLPGEIGRLRGGAAPQGGAGRDRHLDLLTRAARDARRRSDRRAAHAEDRGGARNTRRS